jgi:hypothetical protein
MKLMSVKSICNGVLVITIWRKMRFCRYFEFKLRKSVVFREYPFLKSKVSELREVYAADHYHNPLHLKDMRPLAMKIW